MPNASGDPSQPALRVIVDVLNRHGVEFLVVGGQAESLMGSPRVTYDVDICYRRTPENLARLSKALSELRVSLRDAPPGLPFKPDERTLAAGLNFTFSSTAGPIDILGEVEPIGRFEDLAERAERYRVEQTEIDTIALEDLIRVKRHLNRPRDQESLYQLLAIRRVREETGLR